MARSRKAGRWVVLLVVGALVPLASAVGYGLPRVRALQQQLEQLTERDLPLVERLAAIASQQLSQALLLEEALAPGGSEGEEGERLEALGLQYARQSLRIQTALRESQQQIAEAITESPGPSTGLLRLDARLGEIEAAQARSDALAQEAFDLLAAGGVEGAASSLPPLLSRLGEHRRQLSSHMRDLLSSAAATASETGRQAARRLRTTLLGACALLLVGGLLPLLAARGLHRALAPAPLPDFDDEPDPLDEELPPPVVETRRPPETPLADISPELRRPLSTIRSTLGLLAGGAAGKLSHDMSETVAIARRNCEQVLRVLDDVVDLEALEAFQLELAREPVEPASLAETAVARARGAAERAGVTLEAQIDAEVAGLSLTGDRERLSRMLSDLVLRAVEVSPPGTRAELRVSAAGPGRLRFIVRDAGPQVSERDAEVLFSTILPSAGPAARLGGGVTRGLAVARAIVERHGGEIGLESTRDHGSTFVFELPASEAPAPDPSKPGDADD